MHQDHEIAASPRRLEHRLFSEITEALAKVGDDAVIGEGALDWNRRLWLTLQTDLADERNALPDEIKTGLIELAIWVDRHTEAVLQGRAGVAPLIEINRSIMAGLAEAA